MPRFEPFNGLRYDPTQVDLADVSAPPYDVIDDDHRARLAAQSPFNAVQIDLPVDDDGLSRYEVACRTLNEWRSSGVVKPDEAPTFYVYRMEYTDDLGRPAHTTGVIGALELVEPGPGTEVMPHEQTTPKAKSDRLEMLRSCRANLSAVWCLSLASGLSRLLDTSSEPAIDFHDHDGVRHTVWTVSDASAIAEIREVVQAAPLVVADGHHRYHTSLQYRDERRETDGPGGPYDALMTYVVELVPDELTVRPIHRLLTGGPSGADLRASLAQWFDIAEVGPVGAEIIDQMQAGGYLTLVTDEGAWSLTPKPGAFGDERLDSGRVAQVVEALDGLEVSYQHGVDNVVRLVGKGDVHAGVLLRPATVDDIREYADASRLMAPKTTFFYPKLATGLVYRDLD